jgi:hypothetical protein
MDRNSRITEDDKDFWSFPTGARTVLSAAASKCSATPNFGSPNELAHARQERIAADKTVRAPSLATLVRVVRALNLLASMTQNEERAGKSQTSRPALCIVRKSGTAEALAAIQALVTGTIAHCDMSAARTSWGILLEMGD